jgi:hypothetical protein
MPISINVTAITRPSVVTGDTSQAQPSLRSRLPTTAHRQGLDCPVFSTSKTNTFVLGAAGSDRCEQRDEMKLSRAE